LQPNGFTYHAILILAPSAGQTCKGRYKSWGGIQVFQRRSTLYPLQRNLVNFIHRRIESM